MSDTHEYISDNNSESLLDDAECTECGDWFEYIMKNPKYPRSVCSDCIGSWRERYVG